MQCNPDQCATGLNYVPRLPQDEVVRLGKIVTTPLEQAHTAATELLSSHGLKTVAFKIL